MKIYTKTGDKGETSLFGGERVLKSNLRISAYGTIDELNSFIGLALTECFDNEVKELLFSIQNILFNAGSDLATPITEKNAKLKITRIADEHYLPWEKEIDKFTERLPELRNFILPGGSKSAALLHVCRVVCRRAERLVVELETKETMNSKIVILLNRLSDLLFVLARYENSIQNKPDITWKV